MDRLERLRKEREESRAKSALSSVSKNDDRLSRLRAERDKGGFIDAYTSGYEALQGAYGGWNTKEAMEGYRNTLTNANKAMSDYVNTYNVDDSIREAYNNFSKAYEGFDQTAKAYSAYKNADAFNKAKKNAELTKKYSGATYDKIQKALLRSKDPEEVEFLKGYTDYSSVEDFDKALANASLSDKEREALAGARSNYAKLNPFDEYKGLMNSTDFAEKSKLGIDALQEAEDEAIMASLKGGKTPSVAKVGMGAPSFTQLTGEMKDVAGYIYNTQGEQAYKDYLKKISLQASKAFKEEYSNDYSEIATKNPFNFLAFTAMDMVGTPAMSLGAGIEMLGSAIQGTKYNPYEGLSGGLREVNKAQSEISETIRENTGLIGKPLEIGYNALTTGVTSRLGQRMFGPFYNAIIGTGAFAQEYGDALNSGLSEEKAMEKAVVSGAIEALTEQIGMDWAFKEGKTAIKTIINQFLAEGSEEVVGSLSNLIYDLVRNGSESEFNQNRQKYESLGYSKAQAFGMAAKDFALEVGEAFVTAGLSAGAEGGVHSLATAREGSAIDTESFKNAMEDLGEGSKVYGDYKQMLNSEGNLSNWQKGSLYNRALNEVNEDYKQAKRDFVDEAEGGEWESTENPQSEALNRAEKAVQNYNRIANTKNAEAAKASKAVKTGEKNTVKGKEAEIISMKENKDGTFTIKTSEGEFDSKDVTVTPDKATALSYSANIENEEFKEAYVHYYGGEDIADYDTYARYLYEAGKQGIDFSDQTQILDTLGVAKARAIYNVGAKQALEEEIADNNILEEVANKYAETNRPGTFVAGTYTNGEFTEDEDFFRKLNRTQKKLHRIVEAFSKLSGINVRVYIDRAAASQNGEFISNEEGGTVYINLAARPFADNAYGMNQYVISTLSHELTHWLKFNNMEAYNVLEEAVKKSLTKKGTLEKHIEREKKILEKNEYKGENIDEVALEEVVARGCEDMLNNSDTMQEILSNADQDGLTKLQEAIKKWFDHIKEFFNDLMGGFRSPNEISNDLQDSYAHIRELWTNGMKEAIAKSQKEGQAVKSATSLLKTTISPTNKQNNNPKSVKMENPVLDEEHKLHARAIDTQTLRATFNELNTDKETNKLGKKVFDAFETMQKEEYMPYVIAFWNAKDFIKGFGNGNILGNFNPARSTGPINTRGIRYNVDELNKLNDNEKAEVILHEVIHALTENSISIAERVDENRIKSSGKGREELIAEEERDRVKGGLMLLEIYEQIKADGYGKYYGCESAHEMVAELSNPEFREYLKKKSLWGKVIDAIKKILGIEGNAYDATTKALDMILSQYNQQSRKSVKMDSEGRELSADQAKFFKDSKARDEFGDLMVLYHGTEQPGFTRFGNAKNWFTSNRDVAASYASNDESMTFNGINDREGRIYETYINVVKPLEVDVAGGGWDEIQYNGKKYTTYEIADFARENGYDGLILRNVVDVGPNTDFSEEDAVSDIVVAFKPEQIKATINKRPTGNSDIRFSSKVDALKEYTESEIKNLSNSKKIVLYKGNEQLLDFVHQAKEEANFKKKMYFGKISDSVANAINNKFGIEVENYNCSLGADEVKKVFKDHGDEKGENLRGQRAVKDNDFLYIPYVFASPEKIEYVGEYNKKPMLRFTRGQRKVVGVVSDKHFDIFLQTMYISNKKGLVSAPNEQAFGNTSETTRDTASLDLNISQESKQSNNKRSVKLDSAGNELTERQQEYFKDSKIRDKDGNLLVVYHGTDQDFSIFDVMNHGGKNGKAEGYGIYFTDSTKVSSNYGDKTLKGYLNITNPARHDQKTLKVKDLVKLIQATAEADAKRAVEDEEYDTVEEAIKDTWVSNVVYTYDKPMSQVYTKIAEDLIKTNSNDKDIIHEIMVDMGTYSYKDAYAFYDILKSSIGIDGLVTTWEYEKTGEKFNVYIAFDSNQFKNASNASPTENPDIRYSTKMDSEGRKLTKDQANYFKDSKVLDDNGNLKVMYHGSHRAGFTEFRIADDDLSFFFTDKLNVASSYSGVPYVENPDKPLTYEELAQAFAHNTDGELKDNGDGTYTYEEVDGSVTEKFDSLKKAQAYFFDETMTYVAAQNLGSPSNYAVYLNANNPYIIDAKGEKWHSLVPDSYDARYDDVEIIPVAEGKFEADYRIGERYEHKIFTKEALDAKFGEGVAEIAADEYEINGQFYEPTVFVKDGQRIETTTRDVAKYAHDNGYDSVIIDNVEDIGGYGTEGEVLSQVVIVFNSNQIKSIYNENPTEDKDIRYSTKMDSEGKTLTPGQQKFFKDSKARDDKGRLLRLFHGTGSAGFNVFRVGRSGGIWLTTSRKDAGSYGNATKAYDPNEKQVDVKIVGGNYPVGKHLHFDTEEDRANFLKEYPNAENYMTERELEEAKWDAEEEGDYDRLNELRRLERESDNIHHAYRQYEFAHSHSIKVEDFIKNKEKYSLDDVKRAWLEYDSNAMFDDESEYSEERFRDILAEGLGEALRNNEDVDFDNYYVTARVPVGEESFAEDTTLIHHRIYELYANVKRPYIHDAEGISAEGSGEDYYGVVDKAMQSDEYDGAIIKNIRIGAYKKLGTVVVVKDSSQVKWADNENPTNDLSVLKSTKLPPEAQKLVDALTLENKRLTAENTALKMEKGLEQVKAEKNAIINKITENAQTLSRWLLSNDKNNPVPQAVKEPLGKLLTSISFTRDDYEWRKSHGQMTKAEETLGERMAKISSLLREIEQDKVLDADAYDLSQLDWIPEFTNEFEDIKNAIASVEARQGESFKLSKMTTEDLKSLSNMITALKSAITNMNKCLSAHNKMSVSGVGQEIIGWLDEVGQKEKDNRLLQFLELDNTTPFYFFKRLGSGGEKTFKLLMDGMDKYAFEAKQIEDYAKEAFSGKDVLSWRDEVKTFEVDQVEYNTQNLVKLEKKTIQMTVPQIMSLYCLSKRDQAVKHLKTGGIKIGDFKVDGKETRQIGNTTLTAGDLNKILSSLTDEQRAVADKLQDFMNTVCQKWGNEVTMKRFGFKGMTEKNYFPISVDRNQLSSEARQKGTSLYQLLNMGFTKPINPKAKNPIEIFDIFEVFAIHSTEMAQYNSLALPVLDVIRIWNYKDLEMLDEEESKAVWHSVKASIENALGKKGNQYIGLLLADLNGEVSGGRADDFASKLMKNYKTAAVALNVQVAALQPLSFVRAGYMIDSKYLKKGLTMKSSKEALKWCGMAVWKEMGFYNTAIHRGLEHKIMQDDSTKDRLIEKGLWLAGKADEWTWSKLWNACLLETKDKHPDLEGDDLYKKTADRLTEVIYGTQVVDSVLTRSQIMRDKTFYSKMITAFQSEPTLALNVLMDAGEQFSMEKRAHGAQAALQKHGATVRRAATVYLLSAALESALRAVIGKVRKYDGDEDDENFLEDFFTRFIEELNPLRKIPLVKDVVALMLDSIKVAFGKQYKLYTDTRMDEAIFENIGKAVIRIVKLIEGGDWNFKALYEIAKGIDASGLPVSSFFREFKVIWNNTIGRIWTSLALK